MKTLAPTTRNRKESGFTLIELSIVLVIIGLIVGGVLVGQDLIKAAQIRAQVGQIEAYDAAVNTFHSKYNGMPGDLANAANFFPAADYPSVANCAAVVAGSGSFQNCAGTTISLDGEAAAFWKQLVDASLIGESITSTALIGSTAAIAAPTTISDAFPSAKIGNGNFLTVYTGGPLVVGGMSGVNVYRLAGLASFAVGVPTFANNLTPQEAFQIDTKKDNGLPQTGVVQATDSVGGANFNVAADTFTAGAGACVAVGGIAYNTGSTNAVANSRLCQLRVRASF